MTTDLNMLAAARRGKPEALRVLLAAQYPTVRRMAYGLTGEHAAGRRTVREVMAHAVHAARRWEAPEDVARWFAHHTVLTARRFAPPAPDPARRDPLVSDKAEPAYVAFVRALRGLPLQQREALLLHLGEGWLDRQLGVAMDCSNQAAELHLRNAGQALRTIAADQYQELADRLTAAYQALTPTEEEARVEVATATRRGCWPWVRKGCGCVGTLVLLLGAAVATWWWWPVLVELLRPWLP